ncbi:MAG: IS3 family transposase [Gammaproteobacteria bacterium]|jgi:putative transposase|nr:IS3 family transposase [Gammaproteobacteria bacterium]MBT4145756.1 IS3 family transposase [Gammaproteobacteria bacterium]MBT5221259.1 IS3 family transposase [Gammaproteobacteria bacterium]MBT5825079.1 IS3 family transposase [Gammaproteobacteria bacterium]MBT5966528.1 IS3 family transposase [Gammaproteobacteria bacterium]
MGDVGSYYANAVVEWFYGSLKHDWIFKVYRPTREFMKQEVASYMKYYKQVRLYIANGNISPANFKILKLICPVWVD